MENNPDQNSSPPAGSRPGLAVDLWEEPRARNIYMIIGWRQWADAGSVSSGLPEYLVKHTHARQIGTIPPDGFYLFQLPGTHDLLRPVVRFERGHPTSLDTPHNDLYYTGNNQRGLVILCGDEPHVDVERYTASILHVARKLNIQRIISLGGVYGELPYEHERTIHGIVSRPELRGEMERLAIGLSDYQGGASIGSYLCRRAGDQDIDMIGFYAFVPAYDFSSVETVGGLIRVENDYTAWLGIMRRLNYMFSLKLNLADLEKRSRQLHQAMDDKMEEIQQAAPQFGLREYLQRLAEEHEEVVFNPDDEFWEEKLRDLFDNLDDQQEARN
jgi:proteasome assembly chaperone (PAC2) family protein